MGRTMTPTERGALEAAFAEAVRTGRVKEAAWRAGVSAHSVGMKIGSWLRRAATPEERAAYAAARAALGRPVGRRPSEAKGERACLCCGAPFRSQGIGHRLCARCRRRASEEA